MGHLTHVFEGRKSCNILYVERECRPKCELE
jgi:hypothetical protein